MTEDDCPGEGKCHGCMQWCDWCGHVGYVCDSPYCDSHTRLNELQSELTGMERELAKSALTYVKAEESLHDISDNMDDGAVRSLYRHLSSTASEIRVFERAYYDIAQKIRETQFWESKGIVMVPRAE